MEGSDTLVGKMVGSFHPSSIHKQAARKFLLILYFPSWLYPIMSLSSVVSTNLVSKSPRRSVMDSVRVFSTCLSHLLSGGNRNNATFQ